MRSRRSSGSPATSTSPRRRSRTRSSAPSRRGRVRGVPDNPGAWITTTARNRAIDRLRRRKRLVEKTEELGARGDDRVGAGGHRVRGRRRTPWTIPDDRLRLIFTCCHPALAMDARVALTLRTLGGLTTPEIARAFLVPEPTLAQRLVRAKRKIRDAGHPVPRPAGGAAARAARRRPARAVPRLQRGLRGHVGRCADPARAVRRGDPAGTGRRVAAPRRARGARPAGPDAPPRRPTRGACRAGRRADPARRPGSRPLGCRSDRRRAGARRAALHGATARAVPAPGGDRRAPRRGGYPGRHRLGRRSRRSTERSTR